MHFLHLVGVFAEAAVITSFPAKFRLRENSQFTFNNPPLYEAVLSGSECDMGSSASPYLKTS